MSSEIAVLVIEDDPLVAAALDVTFPRRSHTVEPAPAVVRATPTQLVDAAPWPRAENALPPGFLAVVLRSMTDAVVACDAAGRIIFVNPAFTEQFGAPVEQSALLEALNGDVVRDRMMTATALDGEPHELILNAEPVYDAEHILLGAVVTMRDVTAETVAVAASERHQLHDALTGLPNRAHFTLRVAQVLERHPEGGFAVMHLDIDRFRGVNDHVGQDAGDHVLTEVAQRFAAVVGDGVVARLGGDEFAVLVPDVVDQRDALFVATRLREAIAEPVHVAGEVIRLSMSMGIALAREGAHLPEALLRDAEAATRAAKAGGRSSYQFFDKQMRIEALDRIEERRSLDQALDLNEFTLLYQPKVALDTDRIRGVEALLRWQRPGGTVSPAHFIPLAEESGLIVPLGAWVLRTAAAEGVRWSREFSEFPPLCVSVNVSPRQFRASLVPTVRRILSDTGLDPQLLMLELTEGSVMADIDATITTLRGLKDLGVGISIDDFGTGYSSLAYLKRFPLDELKIDLSFIAGLGRDPEDTAIVAAVIAMAQALQLVVVAEGVEMVDQLDRLRELGCDQVQGYLLARPTTPGAIDTLRRVERGHRSDDHAVGGGRRVLIVDDSATVRQFARVSLSTADYDVHEAATASDGLRMAADLRPDCIVLDVHLPDGIGYDVCLRLRSDPVTAHVTIVMLTSEGEADAKVAAFSAGADDYMVKPFAPRDIVARVATAMRRRADPTTPA